MLMLTSWVCMWQLTADESSSGIVGLMCLLVLRSSASSSLSSSSSLPAAAFSKAWVWACIARASSMIDVSWRRSARRKCRRRRGRGVAWAVSTTSIVVVGSVGGRKERRRWRRPSEGQRGQRWEGWPTQPGQTRREHRRLREATAAVRRYIDYRSLHPVIQTTSRRSTVCLQRRI